MLILRIQSVKEQTGYRSHASIYNNISTGLFTKPVKIGQRAVGWPSEEVRAINVARIAGKSDAEIRELVSLLHAKRTELAMTYGVTMSIDTQSKKPTERPNYSAGQTGISSLAIEPDTDKAFATLVECFARAGHTLTRCTSPDGAVMYYAGRWGMSRALPDLHAAAQLLAQIGGAS